MNFHAPETFTSNPDPRTALTEQEVVKLISLQTLANRLPDGFSNVPRITRIPAPGKGLTPLKSHKRKASEAFEIFAIEADFEPLTLAQAQQSTDWPRWSEALEAEYQSLRKHEVFGKLVTNLKKKPMGHKLIFTKKQNPNGQVTRYKAV